MGRARSRIRQLLGAVAEAGLGRTARTRPRQPSVDGGFGVQLHPWVNLSRPALPSPAMYPGHWAQVTPDKPAVVMAGTDDVVTHRELDQRSIRLARVWHEAGLRPGDSVALFMENQPRFFEVAWAALRSGLRFTPVNRYLTAPEAAYIVNDCDARAIVTSTAMAAVATELADQIPGCKLA